MSLVGHTVGNFQLINKIGQGGMGAVYLAHHPTIGRQVAIKVMRRQEAGDDKMAERFFGEARAVNQISHPHIVEIFDCGREGDRLYLTMEYLQGENLSDRIARRPLTTAEALHIALQICDALQASHSRGIIHRDLKPENIFLLQRGDDDSFVKVLDFGLARMPANLKAYQTGFDEIFGTPTYMSPEQCEGAGRADARSDVYALGLVLYEMLTGCLPFDFKTATETMLAQMLTAPKPPSTHKAEIPGELDGIVMRTLAKNPTSRYQTMDELATQLRRLAPQPSASRPTLPQAAVARPALPTSQGPPRPRLTPDQPTARMLRLPARQPDRRALALVIAAAVLALLAGGIAASWTKRQAHERVDGAATAPREPSHRSAQPEAQGNEPRQLAQPARAHVAATLVVAPHRIQNGAASKRAHSPRPPKGKAEAIDTAASDTARLPAARKPNLDDIMTPSSF